MRAKLVIVVTLLALVAGLAGTTVAAAAPPERVDILISFDRLPGAAEEALPRNAGGAVKYVYHLVPAIAASVPEPAIQACRETPGSRS